MRIKSDESLFIMPKVSEAYLVARRAEIVNSAWRTQDNGTSHAFRLQELKGVNKKALCYNSV